MASLQGWEMGGTADPGPLPWAEVVDPVGVAWVGRARWYRVRWIDVAWASSLRRHAGSVFYFERVGFSFIPHPLLRRHAGSVCYFGRGALS